MSEGTLQAETSADPRGRPNCQQHQVSQGQGRLAVWDYPGQEPAFVLMHGLPDNRLIYDELIPYLTSAGRRVVTFDFLGYGASDKPQGASYSFAQQLGDLEAVVDALQLWPVILVPHDSSGFAALNFAIDRPDRVAGVYMLNSAYADGPEVPWPEMIQLAANPGLKRLADAMLGSSAQFGWMLGWQQGGFAAPLSDTKKGHFQDFIGRIITDNFVDLPGAGAAYGQLTSEFLEEIARNNFRIPRLEALHTPIRLIWGELDPYLNCAMAQARLTHLRNGSLHWIPAGHWLQADEPELVARELLR